MFHWHQAGCSQPTIEDEEGLPWCTNCATQPPLAQLIDLQATNQQPWEPPQDEPVGERNYFWPPSVPYDSEQQHHGNPVDNGADKARSACFFGPTSSSSGDKEEAPDRDDPTAPLAPHYKERLREDQLRLICLRPPAASGGWESALIHLELATFGDDECPEYEAVSYTWGGEDGECSRKVNLEVTSEKDTLFSFITHFALKPY